MSFFLPAFGTFGLIILILIPFFCSERCIRLGYRRARELRWDVEVPSRHGKGYDLSCHVGDKIRQAYLKTKIEPYSMKLSPEQIIAASLTNNAKNDQDEGSTDDSTNCSTSESLHNESIDEESLEKKPHQQQGAPTNYPEKTNEHSTEQGDSKTLHSIHTPTFLMVEQIDDDDEEQHGKICQLPLAGMSTCSENLVKETRQVTNCCAICLGSFDVDETLSWSSNPECQHVFHSECILDWLETSGKKHMKMKRKEVTRSSDQLENDPYWRLGPEERVISFPMNCPCCRQSFLLDTEEDKKSFCRATRKSKQSNSETSIPEGTSDATSSNRGIEAIASHV